MINKVNESDFLKNFFIFVISLFIYCIAVNLFFNPYDIVTAGTTGLAILINNYLHISLSLIILILSLFFLLIGFIIFGYEYGIKNVIGAVLFPLFMMATSLINLVISFDNGISLFLLVVFGGVLTGISFGMMKKIDYNAGTFNVVYDIVHKVLKISIGKAKILCNGIIIIFSIFVFDVSKCIYALIGLYISSVITDKVVLGISSNKAFYIVTSKPKEVKDFIINNLNETVTIVNARGGYSHKRKKMILCVLPTTKYTMVKDIIKEIDKNAFFLITDSYSVSN